MVTLLCSALSASLSPWAAVLVKAHWRWSAEPLLTSSQDYVQYAVGFGLTPVFHNRLPSLAC